MKSSNDIARDVTKSLNDSGVLIKNKTVMLIIESYIDKKRVHLVNGETVEEKGIGSVSAKFRRSNTFGGYVVPTVKLVTTPSNSIKDAILKNIVTDESVKDRISTRIEIGRAHV